MFFRTTLLISILLFNTYVFSQKKATELELKNISGTAYGASDQTPEQVKQKAINVAKTNALKKAGIEENINYYSDYFRSETNEKMGELFTSDILATINGTIKNVEVINYKPGFTNEGQLKASVSINCTVVKYKTKQDLTFNIAVDGIKNIYKEGDGLAFKIRPTHNCYIKAFMFTNEAFILLPNNWEPSQLLEKDKTYKFPDPEVVDSYELNTGGKDRELNRLIIVFLKQNINYYGEVSYKSITDWIMCIPPDERDIKSFAFDVYKEH